MIKTIYILLAVVLLTACVAKRETITTTAPGVNYDMLPEGKATANGSRLWILFIPIGIGNFKYENQKQKAVHKFLKHNNADAVANAKLTYKKIVIPLILVNYSYRWCTIKGTPAKIKN